MNTTHNKLNQRGFSLVSAIFLLVVIAALGAFSLTVFTSQQQSDALDVLGKRTYQAARAGIEWGTFQITQSNVSGTTFAAQCQSPAGYASQVSLAGPTFSSLQPVAVNCAAVTSVDSGTVWIYSLSASAATAGSPGGLNYIERQISVTIAQ